MKIILKGQNKQLVYSILKEFMMNNFSVKNKWNGEVTLDSFENEEVILSGNAIISLFEDPHFISEDPKILISAKFTSSKDKYDSNGFVLYEGDEFTLLDENNILIKQSNLAVVYILEKDHLWTLLSK